MTSPVGNPPGWYQDPWQPNMQRYWDGTAWTPHQTWNVAPAAPAAPAYPGAAAPQAPAYAGPAYRPGPVAPTGQPLAEWWRRLLGWVVDGFVMIPLYIPLLVLLVPAITSSKAWDEFARLAETSGDTAAQLEAQQRLTELLTAEIGGWVVLATLYGVVVSTAYFTVGLGIWGRTVGGKALGIRAVTAAGAIPGYGRAFRRYLPLAGCSLLGLVPVLGLLGNVLLLLIFVSMFFNPQRQAWHDLLAGTYVVRS